MPGRMSMEGEPERQQDSKALEHDSDDIRGVCCVIVDFASIPIPRIAIKAGCNRNEEQKPQEHVRHFE